MGTERGRLPGGGSIGKGPWGGGGGTGGRWWRVVEEEGLRTSLPNGAWSRLLQSEGANRMWASCLTLGLPPLITTVDQAKGSGG